MKRYVVYKHISPSGKVYVGQTCELKKRWRSKGYNYLQKNNKGKYNQPTFAHALLKYGWDNFLHIVILENLTKSEADYAEKYLIRWYKIHNMSYNISDGGEGNSKPMTEEQKRQLTERMRKNNPRRGVHLTEETKQKIRISQVGKVMSKESREKMRKAHLGSINLHRWKKIYAFDINTKELIAEYKSIADAARQLSITSSGICNSAKGKCSSAGGFIWNYTPTLNNGDLRFERAEDRNIYCYNRQYELVGIFKNVKEAADFVGGNMYSLSNCCCGNCSTYKGYIWTRNKIIINNKEEKLCV